MLPASRSIRLFPAAAILMGLWHPGAYLLGAEGSGPARGEGEMDRAARLETGAVQRQRQSERVFDQRFAIGPGGTLRVDLPDGDIDVRTGGSSEVEVEVFLRSRDLEWAREVFERMRFRAEADGSVLGISARYVRIRDYEHRRYYGVGLLVRVTVPTRFNADIVTEDGDIFIGDLDGELSLRSSDGDIEVGRVRGNDAVIETDDGDVRAETLEVGRAGLRTSDGDIIVRSVTGEVEATTSDGDIRVRLGSVTDVRLSTSDGDITIYAPDGLAAEVDLEGEHLNVSRGFDITGRVSRRRIRGEMNGGGGLLQAHTNDGTISLRRGR